MQRRSWTIWLVCLSLLLGSVDGFAKTSSKKKTPPAAQKPLIEKSLDAALLADRLTNSTRFEMEEKFHRLLANPKLKDGLKGPFLAGLAVLHSYDSGIRYAALPLLAEAKKFWSDINKSTYSEKIWAVFAKNMSGREIQEEVILQEAARILDKPELQMDPAFVFHRGVAYFHDGHFAKAIPLLERVPISSADYRRAKLLEAISFSQENDLEKMVKALQIIISLDTTQAEKAAKIPSSTVVQLREMGVLTMARLMYELGRYPEALAYYRSLDRNSAFFYESLSEQAWAFFMAGYPNYAMGANYAVSSPFFDYQFNPDNYFLDSAVSFWMCDYSVAWNKLMRFIEHVRTEGDALKGLVTRLTRLPQNESFEKFAKVAEDIRTGVSAGNLGIGPRVAMQIKEDAVLNDTLAALERLLHIRMQFENSRAIPAGRERILSGLVTFETAMRRVLGRQVRSRLYASAKDFDWNLTQARYLHLEILTARKDDLLGKERSVKGTEFVGDESTFWELSKGAAHKWGMDRNEYWFDELGHYVFEERSRCETRTK